MLYFVFVLCDESAHIILARFSGRKYFMDFSEELIFISNSDNSEVIPGKIVEMTGRPGFGPSKNKIINKPRTAKMNFKYLCFLIISIFCYYQVDCVEKILLILCLLGRS
ncbi:MAG: hypothetical protein ACM3RX_07355, partial [Methanococcaceae archaeon]